MSRFFAKMTERFGSNSSKHKASTTPLLNRPYGRGDEESSGKNRSAAHARRREQVRRAQKSHRERKAEYLKTLEIEVTELRETNAAKTWEIRKYRGTIATLKNLLQTHGIELPADIDNETLAPPLAKVEVWDQSGGSHSLKTTFPTNPITSPSSSESTMFGNLLLSNPQVGINFVLALEHPCLPHFQSQQLEDGDGHSMQLQAPLIAHRFQSISAGVNQQALTTGATWDIPAQELDDQLRRLLSYAQQLSLDGELTPVLVWSRIQAHPQTAAITETKLDEITQALLKGVVCYGFGAVVDEQFFKQTIDRCLTGSRP